MLWTRLGARLGTRFELLSCAFLTQCYIVILCVEDRPRPQNCRDLQRQNGFSWLDCDDENPGLFERLQCRPGFNNMMWCFCVNPMSGERIADRSFNTRDASRCNSKLNLILSMHVV